MNLKQSQRQNVKLRLGISGASGFGKTTSALLLAYGMTKDWSKIAVIDTENSLASLYSDLGNFNVLNLQAPFSPERYIEAIQTCEKAGMEVCILDSITHEWTGSGGCLQIHEQLGGRFQDWARVTPRHQAFIDKILQSKCHIITTTRRKIDYSLDIGSNGKAQVVKHGTKEITREGYEYEITVNFELVNDKHLAKASKDRTGLFMNKPEFIINEKVGEKLLQWCNSGKTAEEPKMSQKEVHQKIQDCTSIQQLLELFREYPQFQGVLKPAFEEKKGQLLQVTNSQNFNQNGITKHT